MSRDTPDDDLALGAACCALLAVVLVAAPVRGTPIPIVAAPLYLIALPGYAFVSAVLPRHVVGRSVADSSGPSEFTLRLVLSIGVGTAIAGLSGLAMYLADAAITRTSLVVVLGSVTLLCFAVAGVRRRRVAPATRYRAGLSEPWERLRLGIVDGPPGGTLLPVLVLTSLLVSASVVGVAISSPDDAERYTELSVLPVDDDEPTAGPFPEQLTSEEERLLSLRVQNDEHRRTSYTLVVLSQRIEGQNGSVDVAEAVRERRFELTLDPGETWNREYSYGPSVTGESVRVAFVLYRGDPPTEPSLRTAYREVHFWTTVGGNES